MRRDVLLLAMFLALATSGCATHVNGTWIGDEGSPATRSELYRRHGPPDAIRRTDTDRLFLRYDYSEDRGITLGARSTPTHLGAGIVLSRISRAGDRVWVEVASDGRVVGFETLRATPKLRYRLWPFGK